MSKVRKQSKVSMFVLVLSVVGVWAEDATNFSGEAKFGTDVRALQDLSSITPGYRREALRLLIGEANKVALELHLHESLPIKETNLVATYITPPKLTERLGAVGNVTTSNYTYYFSVGKKFSFVTRTGLDREYGRQLKKSLLPMGQMDTNAAYRFAVKWLSEASMDVKALNRDCNVHVLAFTPQGDRGQYFVPIYWVYWSKAPEGHGSTASVELFAPSNTLLDLRVEDSAYILRAPLNLRNPDIPASEANQRNPSQKKLNP